MSFPPFILFTDAARGAILDAILRPILSALVAALQSRPALEVVDGHVYLAFEAAHLSVFAAVFVNISGAQLGFI